MMYEDVVAEFAWRTQQNLRLVEESRRQGTDAFETTQLINSMLGLLVFPREEYVDRIPRIPLAQLRAAGWPLPRVRNDFSQAGDLAELVRYLRNAISHFNLEFRGDAQNRIAGLRVWNMYRGEKTWEADLELDELRGIAERFTEVLLNASNFTPAD